MVLMVESGQGLALATSYAAVATADACAVREDVAAWAQQPEAKREVALIRATAALDVLYRFRGRRLTLGQALAWPRRGAYDDDGFALTGVPRAVAECCCLLAFKALEGPLLKDPPAGGAIQRLSERLEGLGREVAYDLSDRRPDGRPRDPYPWITARLTGLVQEAGVIGLDRA